MVYRDDYAFVYLLLGEMKRLNYNKVNMLLNKVLAYYFTYSYLFPDRNHHLSTTLKYIPILQIHKFHPPTDLKQLEHVLNSISDQMTLKILHNIQLSQNPFRSLNQTRMEAKRLES